MFHPLNGIANDQNILPRQSVNYNSNANQGDPDNSNSYSYSSSSSSGPSDGPQTSVNYNLNGVSVPKPLTGYQPDAIRNACDQFLGNSGSSSSGSGGNNQTP